MIIWRRLLRHIKTDHFLYTADFQVTVICAGGLIVWGAAASASEVRGGGR